jgi:hypothetical protein
MQPVVYSRASTQGSIMRLHFSCEFKASRNRAICRKKARTQLQPEVSTACMVPPGCHLQNYMRNCPGAGSCYHVSSTLMLT